MEWAAFSRLRRCVQVDAVGKARAKELIYTARVVRAEEAREIGIVQAMVRRTTVLAGRCCLWVPVACC